MGYTRNKRRANNFRKSRQLQINKKATRRQYKGGARQTKKRGQKGGIGGIGSEIKAGFMDQAKKNVAMKLTIEQAGKTLTPEELQIIDNMFPEDQSGKVGVEENYLNTKEKETKTFRDDVLGKKRSGFFGLGKDTRRVTTAATDAAAAAAAKQQTAADANKELDDAKEALEAFPEGAMPPAQSREKKAAVSRVEAALKAQKEAQKDVESKDNTKILSDKVFEIFKKGGSISFVNIFSLTKAQTSNEQAKNEVVFKGPKICTLTVVKGEKGEKITFSYSDTEKIRPDKNYDFVKSGDNVEYDANRITLRVQRGSKIPTRAPEKRTLEMTYNEDTTFVFNSAADATAAVASQNKILLNKVLSVYLNNLDNLKNADDAFSAETIEKTAVVVGGGGGDGAPPADAGGGVRAGGV